MATDSTRIVQEYMARHRLPLRVWLSPGMLPDLAEQLEPSLPPGAQIAPTTSLDGHEPLGPAILLLSADELQGPHRKRLLELTRIARPGRPVIFGGTSNKNVLLDAINHWRVFQLLPARPPMDELVDALLRAYDAYATEHAAILCASELRTECLELQRVQDELEQTRDKLLLTERATTVESFSRFLGDRLRQHMDGLHELVDALSTLPGEPHRKELRDSTTQCIASIRSLLAELLAKAESAAKSVQNDCTAATETE